MTKTKSTKRALLMSALALVMCVSMLIGSTFAWFTDSVTSGGNTIQSGTLKVDLVNAAGESLAGKQLTFKTADNRAQDQILWEPGCTYEIDPVFVKNNGNLALKYQIVINGIDGDAKLLEAIEWKVMYGTGEDAEELDLATFEGHLDTNGALSKAIVLVGHMKEEANNDYQGLTADGISITVYATQYTYENDSFDNQYDYAAGTAFVGGKGTADAPYLINEASQLLSISDYDEYTYFKVADGVETLDMTGVGKIKLNGSFDGNGVTMNNLTTALFQSVGKSGVAQDIKISNLTANVNVTDGSALVKNIYNSGETTFENVTLHGYIEGQYNMGSFYNYGTANAGDSDGADYTVNFVNTKSDATLVNTTGNAIGGMLGHGYEGADYMLSINMDANSGYTGDMYTTGTATCYKVMALCSHATYVLNGTEVSRYNDTYPSTRLTMSAPTAGTDGYYVTPIDGVDHYVVYLNSQLTAYDANGNKIANKAGMTWNLGKETIASSLDGKVFDLITSANIVNDTANDLGYAMNNGELTIYSGRSDNYASGWVTLQVNQYDANGGLLATGITTVHTFAEP